MNYQDYIQVKPLKILVFVDKSNKPSVNKVVDVLNFVHGNNYKARSVYIDELCSLRAINLCMYIDCYDAIYILLQTLKKNVQKYVDGYMNHLALMLIYRSILQYHGCIKSISCRRNKH